MWTSMDHKEAHGKQIISLVFSAQNKSESYICNFIPSHHSFSFALTPFSSKSSPKQMSASSQKQN